MSSHLEAFQRRGGCPSAQQHASQNIPDAPELAKDANVPKKDAKKCQQHARPQKCRQNPQELLSLEFSAANGIYIYFLPGKQVKTARTWFDLASPASGCSDISGPGPIQDVPRDWKLGSSKDNFSSPK